MQLSKPRNFSRKLGVPRRGFMGFGDLAATGYTDDQLMKAIGNTYADLTAAGWTDATIAAYMANWTAQQASEPWYLSIPASVAKAGLSTLEETFLPTLFKSKTTPAPRTTLSFMDKYGYFLIGGGVGIAGLMFLLGRRK